MFDENAALERCQRIWLKLARLAERRAYSEAKEGRLHNAISAGRIAEACYWKATGGQDCESVEKLRAAA